MIQTKDLAVRRAKLFLTALSVVIASSVGLMPFNISMQVSEGIINTAGSYDIIIGPAGSSTQLAMNTIFLPISRWAPSPIPLWTS